MTVEGLYQSIGGSYEDAKRTLMMDKMITRFILKLPDDPSFSTLWAAFQAGEEKGMFQGAHAMKGVCANLGLTELSRQAGEITEQFRPGSPRTLSGEELAQRMEQLKTGYDKAVEGIRAFAAEQG